MSEGEPVVSIYNRETKEVNEEAAFKLYGITAEEATTTVRFGPYEGKFAEALDDARCPVGPVLRKARAENAQQGVENALQGLHMMDANFRLQLSDTTKRRYQEEVKKKLINQMPPMTP